MARDPVLVQTERGSQIVTGILELLQRFLGNLYRSLMKVRHSNLEMTILANIKLMFDRVGHDFERLAVVLTG